MRVLIAVLALVATPVIASVAQGQGSTPPASVRQNCANDHRWQEGNHVGDKNAGKQGCDPASGTTGSGTIGGFVFYDMNKTGTYVPGGPGIAGWVLQITGPVTLTTTSDMLGNYAFPPVPAGTYTLCQAKVSSWTQSLPANNGCYTVVLTAGAVLNTYYFGFWI
jgi:hypothetical protein